MNHSVTNKYLSKGFISWGQSFTWKYKKQPEWEYSFCYDGCDLKYETWDRNNLGERIPRTKICYNCQVCRASVKLIMRLGQSLNCYRVRNFSCNCWQVVAGLNLIRGRKNTKENILLPQTGSLTLSCNNSIRGKPGMCTEGKHSSKLGLWRDLAILTCYFSST